jgi:hypothetical protein
MTSLYTRRRFLHRASALALAAGATGLAWEQLTSPAMASGSLAKCISMGGPGTLRQEGHPDDYRLWGNREFIRDLSETTWVKLWVSWYELQNELGVAPANRAASWSHLNGAPSGFGYLRRLDAQVRAIKDDGLRVIVTLYHNHPAWSSGATGGDPVSGTKPAEQKLPLDVSPNGPWAWFISHLLARYRPGSPPNPIGPHEPTPGEDTTGYDPRAGNPLGASIDALEICNEPNHLNWPQEGVEQVVAQMIRSAAALSAAAGGTRILAPATSDFPDSDSTGTGGFVGREWNGFTQRVLAELGDFRPTVPVSWSHHNYRDVRLGEDPTRAERVLGLLAGAPWVAQPGPLWLTEGGLNLGSSPNDPARRSEQATKIERNFRRMMSRPEVYMWTQHTISDKQGNSFHSGLRDDFVYPSSVGAERPAWYAYQALPGAPPE